MNRSRLKAALSASVLCLLLHACTPITQSAAASDRQEIRLYKVNKDGITQRLRFTRKKSKQPGCHNLVKRARLHKAVQFEFKQCQVFANKDCAADSLMPFYRDKDETPATELLQGYGWYPVGEHERGELIRSWRCE